MNSTMEETQIFAVHWSVGENNSGNHLEPAWLANLLATKKGLWMLIRNDTIIQCETIFRMVETFYQNRVCSATLRCSYWQMSGRASAKKYIFYLELFIFCSFIMIWKQRCSANNNPLKCCISPSFLIVTYQKCLKLCSSNYPINFNSNIWSIFLWRSQDQNWAQWTLQQLSEPCMQRAT